MCAWVFSPRSFITCISGLVLDRGSEKLSSFFTLYSSRLLPAGSQGDKMGWVHPTVAGCHGGDIPQGKRCGRRGKASVRNLTSLSPLEKTGLGKLEAWLDEFPSATWGWWLCQAEHWGCNLGPDFCPSADKKKCSPWCGCKVTLSRGLGVPEH